MKLTTLKDLTKLIALCRKQGVEFIKIDGFELKLSDIPAASQTRRKTKVPAAEVEIPYAPGGITAETPVLTDDQLLFWSSGEQQ